MTCQELADLIAQLQPEATSQDIARLCLLLINSVEDTELLHDPQVLHEAWSEANLRLQAAADQHAAMTEELEQLAQSDPRQFNPEQVWVLVRAIKVQSQILELYLGQPALDV